jgi:hypothetical protein
MIDSFHSVIRHEATIIRIKWFHLRQTYNVQGVLWSCTYNFLGCQKNYSIYDNRTLKKYEKTNLKKKCTIIFLINLCWKQDTRIFFFSSLVWVTFIFSFLIFLYFLLRNYLFLIFGVGHPNSIGKNICLSSCLCLC